MVTGEQTYPALVPRWGELRQGSSSPGEGGTVFRALLSGSAQHCGSRGVQQERLTNDPAFEDSQAWSQSHTGSFSVAEESKTHGLWRWESQTSQDVLLGRLLEAKPDISYFKKREGCVFLPWANLCLWFASLVTWTEDPVNTEIMPSIYSLMEPRDQLTTQKTTRQCISYCNRREILHYCCSPIS